MMSRHTLLSIGLMLAGMTLPLQTAAYVTPDEALDDESFNASQFFAPPPSTREADAMWDAQNSSAAAQRAAAQQANYDAQHPEDDTMHGAAPETEEDMGAEWEALIKALESLSEEKEEDTAALTTEELRQQRILNRIEVQQAQAAYQAQLQALGLGNGNDDEVLHSGAPLSDTGPAATLTALALALAIGETMRRVRKAEQQQQI